MEAIVGLEDERTFTVTPFDLISHDVQHHSAQPRIDALDAPGSVGEVIGVTKGDAIQRVRHREDIAANVVGGARPEPVRCVRTVALDSLDRASESVDRDARRSEMMACRRGAGERGAIRPVAQRREVVSVVGASLPGRGGELLRISQIQPGSHRSPAARIRRD